MSAKFSIDGRAVGPGEKSYLIAEIAQAHDGSLGYAHAFIDLAKDCGADAVKFQTWKTENLVSKKSHLFNSQTSICICI